MTALLDRMCRARAQTDALFALVTPEGLRERPIAERHRLVFYLGHLDAFDWNLLCRDSLGAPSRHAAWERLFAFGIDPLDGAGPSDTADAWPAIEELRGWTDSLRADVDVALVSAPRTGWLAGDWAAHLAIEHRLMHAETLAYALSHLAYEHKQPGPLPDRGPSEAPRRELCAIPTGTATLGLARSEAPHLGWDNEYERHVMSVPAFRIDAHPVTNADFQRFVDAGGYGERTLWSDSDWVWRASRGVDHPAFWAKREGVWHWRAMFGELPLPPAWPVYVSHAEASAYARWVGGALPTEAQWHRAAYGALDEKERPFPWGNAAPVPGTHGAFGLVRFDPSPVRAFPAGASAFGVHDLFGAGWQWTRTPFAPFAGFEPLPFYLGYSRDFFDGKHYVLKGASTRTDVTFLRRSFRNWFQAHYGYAYTTFRCVEEG